MVWGFIIVEVMFLWASTQLLWKFVASKRDLAYKVNPTIYMDT